MFSTPLMLCSSGTATVSSTVCESAPGYVACTWICGGVTFGYSSIASPRSAIRPNRTIRIERTIARIGRRTNRPATARRSAGRGRRRGRTRGRDRRGAERGVERDLVDRDRHARLDLQLPIGDDAVPGGESARDLEQAVRDVLAFEAPLLGDVARADRVDGRHALHEDHRA